DLLAKAFERCMCALDRLTELVQAMPDELWRVVRNEILGEILRDLVDLPAVPDLAVDLEPDLAIEGRSRRSHASPLSLPRSCSGATGAVRTSCRRAPAAPAPGSCVLRGEETKAARPEERPGARLALGEQSPLFRSRSRARTVPGSAGQAVTCRSSSSSGG